MFIKYFKLILIILFFNQTPLYSKNKAFNELNSHYLSSYFSGIVAYENKKNLEALEFFNSSRILINKHSPYLKKYIYSLVLENKIKKATNEIKRNLGKSNTEFFEGYIILALDSLKKNKLKKSRDYLEQSSDFIYNDRFKLVIYETLKQYLFVFDKKKFLKDEVKFGNLSFINKVFQSCYLDSKDTNTYFAQIINSNSDTDYSRYIFFNINYLIENNKFNEATEIIDKEDYLNSSILISQGKKWIEEKKFDEFSKIFSCKNPNDIIGEFFFLIANLYSSQYNYEKSNFYLNISNYLNPKFRFNLTLLAENYYLNKNYKKALKTLEYFDKKDDFYYWFKIKKQAQIIAKEKNKKDSINFINEEFQKIRSPSIKMIFDVANFNKNSQKYKNAINFYSQIISMIDHNSDIYANILYRRGSSYERLGDYLKSDKDFLKSLEINPDDVYVLNYLAYSWLERDYKIDTAIAMLEKAYAIRSDDPYIIDSVGWAYYLVDDFLKAETFLKRAVELMPDDPVVNDHYGDILWKLNRKIQARYFWVSVLNLKETDEEMKEKIQIKLIKGLSKS